MHANLMAMGEYRARPIRESRAFVEKRMLPSAPDLLFVASISMAVLAGLALGATLG